MPTKNTIHKSNPQIHKSDNVSNTFNTNAQSTNMSPLIHLPMSAISMSTYLHRYMKTVKNQINLITGLKITIGKTYWQLGILAPTKNHETSTHTSQFSNLRPTWPNIIKMQDQVNGCILTYILMLIPLHLP